VTKAFYNLDILSPRARRQAAVFRKTLVYERLKQNSVAFSNGRSPIAQILTIVFSGILYVSDWMPPDGGNRPAPLAVVVTARVEIEEQWAFVMDAREEFQSSEFLRYAAECRRMAALSGRRKVAPAKASPKWADYAAQLKQHLTLLTAGSLRGAALQVGAGSRN
jgi:hypothetical protein